MAQGFCAVTRIVELGSPSQDKIQPKRPRTQARRLSMRRSGLTGSSQPSEAGLTSGLPKVVCRGIRSLAPRAHDMRRPHELKRCQHKTEPGLPRPLRSFDAPCYYTTLTCSGRSRFQDGFVGSGKCFLFGGPSKNRPSAALGNCSAGAGLRSRSQLNHQLTISAHPPHDL